MNHAWAGRLPPAPIILVKAGIQGSLQALNVSLGLLATVAIWQSHRLRYGTTRVPSFDSILRVC